MCSVPFLNTRNCSQTGPYGFSFFTYLHILHNPVVQSHVRFPSLLLSKVCVYETYSSLCVPPLSSQTLHQHFYSGMRVFNNDIYFAMPSLNYILLFSVASPHRDRELIGKSSRCPHNIYTYSINIFLDIFQTLAR